MSIGRGHLLCLVRSEYGGWYCSLRVGHEGAHQAYASHKVEGGKLLCEWERRTVTQTLRRDGEGAAGGKGEARKKLNADLRRFLLSVADAGEAVPVRLARQAERLYERIPR